MQVFQKNTFIGLTVNKMIKNMVRPTLNLMMFRQHSWPGLPREQTNRLLNNRLQKVTQNKAKERQKQLPDILSKLKHSQMKD